MFNISASWDINQTGEQNVLNQILEGQKQILQNQTVIFNRVVSLEQRFFNLEKVFNISGEHFTETQVKSSKGWFTKSFEFQGFSTSLSMECSEAFPIPVLLKRKIGTVEIRLKWIRNDVTLGCKKDEVEGIFTRQMKLYLKKFDSPQLILCKDIPPGSVALKFMPDNESLSVLISHDGYPLSAGNKAYLNLGIAENGSAEPALLLRDIIHFSKVPLNGAGMLDAVLTTLIKASKTYKNAYWHTTFLQLCNERGIGTESKKRARSMQQNEQEEGPQKKNVKLGMPGNIPASLSHPSFLKCEPPPTCMAHKQTAQVVSFVSDSADSSSGLPVWGLTGNQAAPSAIDSQQTPMQTQKQLNASEEQLVENYNYLYGVVPSSSVREHSEANSNQQLIPVDQAVSHTDSWGITGDQEEFPQLNDCTSDLLVQSDFDNLFFDTVF